MFTGAESMTDLIEELFAFEVCTEHEPGYCPECGQIMKRSEDLDGFWCPCCEV